MGSYLPAKRMDAEAMSFNRTLLPGEPRTTTLSSSISRSDGEASSISEAIVKIWLRASCAAASTNTNFIGHHLVDAEIVIVAAIVSDKEETTEENRRTGVCPGIKNDFAL